MIAMYEIINYKSCSTKWFYLFEKFAIFFKINKVNVGLIEAFTV